MGVTSRSNILILGRQGTGKKRIVSTFAKKPISHINGM
jgi:ATP-dependent protease Clp ATPase subunit